MSVARNVSTLQLSLLLSDFQQSWNYGKTLDISNIRFHADTFISSNDVTCIKTDGCRLVDRRIFVNFFSKKKKKWKQFTRYRMGFLVYVKDWINHLHIFVSEFAYFCFSSLVPRHRIGISYFHTPLLAWISYSIDTRWVLGTYVEYIFYY